ncbi:class I SAM-dependent methyltransferase [Micromonospora sp. WMMD714]|uniref:class I SAM-dependent methyltransferase n=1 Tax=Micromonospora sp. WMMD714 TaxID=3016097 RepID=UPI00249B2EA0|nr:class I SAM-dependent methyltransferase [Micromonospora sp. WMMD714]WFE66345.1 class I SAM-dependent methyltransferase [Micromonospora sp. WMMD714]
MAIMVEVFGEVAADYDEIRPGYPAALAGAILAYHGGPPARLVEVGAGTGLATALLVGLVAADGGDAPTGRAADLTGPGPAAPAGGESGAAEAVAPGPARVTCVEPDARMAAVLTARFPDVEVAVTRFEQWSPPSGGVPLLACALAWHWLDPATRNRRAYDALAPGGTLAVFAHRYDYVDPARSAAIRAAFESVDPVPHHDQPEDWFHTDITASGLFTDVRTVAFRRAVPLDTAAYQRLVGTFSPQLRRPPELRERVLSAIGAAVDGFGGTVTLDLRTTLVLARRAAGGETGGRVVSIRPGSRST